MKFNYSGPKTKIDLKEMPMHFFHQVISFPAVGKNHSYTERDLEKRHHSRELTIANKMLAFQNKEKEKRAAELVIANKELAFQNKEKEKRAAELEIANKELAFQNKEKEKRAAELLAANEELAYYNEEKENLATELIMANDELAYQNEEKEKRAAELNAAYKELKNTDDYLKEYTSGLEEMMFITSHKVRQPVCNILGVASILDQFLKSPGELKKLVGYLKKSALSLDDFTKELTAFISDLEQKGQNKNPPVD